MLGQPARVNDFVAHQLTPLLGEDVDSGQVPRTLEGRSWVSVYGVACCHMRGLPAEGDELDIEGD